MGSKKLHGIQFHGAVSTHPYNELEVANLQTAVDTCQCMRLLTIKIKERDLNLSFILVDRKTEIQFHVNFDAHSNSVITNSQDRQKPFVITVKRSSREGYFR